MGKWTIREAMIYYFFDIVSIRTTKPGEEFLPLGMAFIGVCIIAIIIIMRRKSNSENLRANTHNLKFI